MFEQPVVVLSQAHIEELAMEGVLCMERIRGCNWRWRWCWRWLGLGSSGLWVLLLLGPTCDGGRDGAEDGTGGGGAGRFFLLVLVLVFVVFLLLACLVLCLDLVDFRLAHLVRETLLLLLLVVVGGGLRDAGGKVAIGEMGEADVDKVVGGNVVGDEEVG